MAHRERSNQGALSRVEWVFICARRVAVHVPDRGNVAQVKIPGKQLRDLRVALRRAGVDMAKAERRSEGAVKAAKTAKKNKGKP